MSLLAQLMYQTLVWKERQRARLATHPLRGPASEAEHLKTGTRGETLAYWYLRQAGGVTKSGDRGAVFVIRANGSVVGHSSGWLTGDSLSFRMRPGDTIIVPEKSVGSQVWKNLISMAQIASSVAITGAVAGVF